MQKKSSFEIKLDPELSELDLENIQNTLPYLTPEIERFEINREISCVSIWTQFNTNIEKIQKLVQDHIESIKPVEIQNKVRVIFDHSHIKPRNTSQILDALIERRELIEHGPGIFSLHGKLHQMYQGLDNTALNFAREQGAQESTFPITIRIDTLKKSNFFSSYPHFANFISTLKENKDTLSAAPFSEGHYLKIMAEPLSICRSAGCLHSYPSLEGQVFNENQSHCVTMSGRMFRNESKNVSGLERLNEYGMREIIYFGTPEYVQDRLNQCVDWFKNFMMEGQLQGVIQSANDPFFGDNLATLQFFQRSQQSKLEARLVNPSNGNRVSIGSINFHGSHFSKAYNIRFKSGDYISTGCVGFGLERSLFLTLAQHGYDENQWPKILRSVFLGHS